jgi:simple sugar transport system permease protein
MSPGGAWRAIGLPRLLIFLFLVLIWVVAAVGTDLGLGRLLVDSLVRTGMNGVLVLALVPMVRAGVGLNFGLPLGIVCGLVGAVLAIEWGFERWVALAVAAAVSAPVAAAAGLAYAALLERVRGQEMMVGIYVGFGAVALMSVVWLVAPVSSPELIWPLGGSGVRNTIRIDSAFAERTDAWAPGEVLALLAVWLAACVLVHLFSRTQAGAALDAAGENDRFATAIGIPVARLRRLGVVLSTVLAAFGIIVFSHGYHFLQLYKAPLLMALPAVAALLLGGATVARATVVHAVLGTFLFQSLLTGGLPVVNALVSRSGQGEALANLPEVARLIIANGIILYALTRKGSA